MRIGSYWGIPAPMLLLAYRDDEKLLKEHVNNMRLSGNSEIIENLHKEFVMLKQLKRFLNVSFTIDTPISEQFPNLLISNGKLLDTTLNPIILEDLKYEILIRVVQMIYDGERKDNFCKIEANNLKQELRTVINSYVDSATFEVSELNKVCRKIYKSIKTDEKNILSEKLLAMFPHVEFIPDSVMLNGNRLIITEEMKKVCKYFLDKMPLVDEILQITEVVTEEERRIFGVSFFDLLKRKPESLLFLVQNKFDYIKNKQTATAVQAVTKEVRMELDKFIENKNVYVTNSQNEMDHSFFDNSKALRHISAQSADCSLFFTRLLSEGVRAEDFIESDFVMLLEMFNKIHDLDYTFFCEEFNLDVTEKELESMFYDLTFLGISGLNLYSIVLFEESIYNITLSEIGTITKSNEYLTTLDQILFDIQSLLKTIKPIGAMVNE